MKGIPEIRFNKYSEKWESLNAGTLFYPVTDKGYPELPVLSASQEEGMIPRKDIGINMSYSRKNVGGYKRVLPGDFVVHLRSFQGGFAHSASEGITSPAYTVLRLNKEKNQDDNFWKHYMTSMNFIDSLRIVTYGIRDGRNINVSEFLDTNLIFPKDKQEQTAIGKFFDDLDEYISSQALELQKLKNIKKACLEKMFPKEGELVPEIRFDGFEGNWERTTLGRVMQNFKVSNELVKNNNLLSLSYGQIILKDIKGQNGLRPASYSTYHVIKPGILVLRLTDLQNDHKSLRVGLSNYTGIISPAYVCLETKEDIDSSFAYYLLTLYDSIYKKFYKMGNGLRQTLGFEELKELEIVFPKEKKEQEEISRFLSKLDSNIQLHSSRIDKLKQIRKGLLEKMFIANN